MIAAVVLKAIADAQVGDAEARDWLMSSAAAEWLDEIGISEARLDAWRAACAAQVAGAVAADESSGL